jgi:hypothetical protein
MKYARSLLLFISFFLLCACSFFGSRQSAPAPEVQPSKPLVLPVGKNWQIIEEAPKLSNDTGRLPFQMEQSVQPEGTQPLPPVGKRTIETPR